MVVLDGLELEALLVIISIDGVIMNRSLCH